MFDKWYHTLPSDPTQYTYTQYLVIPRLQYPLIPNNSQYSYTVYKADDHGQLGQATLQDSGLTTTSSEDKLLGKTVR